jgi:hypothetical protein
MDDSEVKLVAGFADKVLDLGPARLSDEYYYQSLPICVIDAVYSIGVLYVSVQRVVDRYCQYFNLPKIRSDKENLPPKISQESISEFCQKIEEYGIEAFSDTIFNNKQRTSTKNGILKAEAVYRFATVLKRHNAEYLQDVPHLMADTKLESDIRDIPGQRSGISLQYFFMLAGSDDLIKPDRMILRFLQSILGRAIGLSEAQLLLASAANHLVGKYPCLTPKLLDYEIWKYQRQQAIPV